jgi:hypothetical protein
MEIPEPIMAYIKDSTVPLPLRYVPICANIIMENDVHLICPDTSFC